MNFLAKCALAVAGAAILCLVVYLTGRSHGAERIQARWDADRAVLAEAFAKATEQANRVTEARVNGVQEEADALKSKLAVAEQSVAGLAGRVLAYAARAGHCALPGGATAPPGDREALAVADGLAAVKRDLDALGVAGATADAQHRACVAAYERVRTAGD